MIALVVLAGVAVVAVVGWMNLRRHGEASVPAGNWTRTDEVFRDPSSDRIMRVWLDPSDGTRHYVPE
ncbi:MAG TPA: hypothetical protein VHT97_09500 [Acidimicrobiales bacterium]|nr:hypothetical protein [Acidimicrobiales bacterium]